MQTYEGHKDYLTSQQISELGVGLSKPILALRHYSTDGKNRCSMVVTSGSCYALTAAHCVEDVLLKHPSFKIKTLEYLPSVKFGDISPEQLREKKVFIGKDKLELIAVGRNFPLGNSFHNFWSISGSNGESDYQQAKSIEEIFKDLHQRGMGPGRDWALLKINDTNCNCVSASEKKENDKAILLGFSKDSGFTVHGEGEISPHLGLSLGSSICKPRVLTRAEWGKGLSAIKQFVFAIRHGAQAIEEEKRYRAYRNVFSEYLHFTDARGNPGGSGGGLVDSEMNLKGITSFGSTDNLIVGRFAAATKISKIKSDLKEMVEPDLFAEIFRCDQIQKVEER